MINVLYFFCTLHSSLLDVKQQNNNQNNKKKFNKTAIVLVKSHRLIIHSHVPLSQETQMDTHLITVAFYWLQKYCYGFHFRKPPKKARMWIAVSNLYI